MEMNLVFQFVNRNSEETFEHENKGEFAWTQTSAEAPDGPEDMQGKTPS